MPFLVELEGRATDWLFLHGRPAPPAASDRIVHCDIDDSSIETVGRWPWPRSVLAEAIEELDALGAKVILLDLILTDPQEPEYLADGTLVDHDAILAETLGRVPARTVLAASVDTDAMRLGSLWQGAEGRRKWDEIRALLRRDITLDDEEIAREARLDGTRAARVQGRLLAIKALVAREAAEELRHEGRPCTEEEMRARLLPPEKDARLREFPSLAVIRAAVRNAQALDAMERKLPRAQADRHYLGAGMIVPPLPAFARAAAAVGVANSRQDSDGLLRRLLVRWEADGAVFPQLGLAAAAVYLDTPRDALAATPLAIGDLRIGGDEMLLSWPGIDPSRVDFGLHPHVSLGRVIDLRRTTGRLAAQEAEIDDLARGLVAAFLADRFAPEDCGDPERRREIEAELLSEVEFRLPEEGAEEREEVEEDREKLRRLRRWLRLREEAAAARAEVAKARVQLEGVIRGRLVLVGWNATGNFGDFFPTAAHERTPGVVAHAIVANSALTGYVVRPLGAWASAALTLALGAAAAFLAAATGPRLSFLLALLLSLL
ncbi:MAG: CHASE2 domain-containing protein, partial [Planctomycetes bacterium]|nr:CHASE2 domain-containing protein [Planctomycetota bacterium]